MIVGDDEALAVDDHARAQRVLDPLAWGSEDAIAAEELAEERIGERSLVALRHKTPRIDIDHSGRGLLDHRREGHLDLGTRFRHPCLGKGRQRNKAAQDEARKYFRFHSLS